MEAPLAPVVDERGLGDGAVDTDYRVDLSLRDDKGKYIADDEAWDLAESALRACEQAVRTLGGMGYAAEYDVERYFREMVAARGSSYENPPTNWWR